MVDVGGLHAAQNSHAATDGGFIPGGRRSKALSHTHSGTPDIRTAVRCGRDIATPRSAIVGSGRKADDGLAARGLRRPPDEAYLRGYAAIEFAFELVYADLRSALLGTAIPYAQHMCVLCVLYVNPLCVKVCQFHTREVAENAGDSEEGRR